MSFSKNNKHWMLGKGNRKHGLRHKRIYNIWRDMWQRCTNKNNNRYKNYGARGISVCDEWKDPKAFADWAFQSGYSENLTLDRVDNNGNYCPQNCKWSTYTEQNNNRTTNVFFEFNGERHTCAEWSRITGISAALIWARINLRGWSIEKTLTTPPIHRGEKEQCT